MLRLPLTPLYLNKIRLSIRQIAEQFQISTIPKDQIGREPGGRYLVEAAQWPINDALDFFYKEGAISRPPSVEEIQRGLVDFEILKPDYFDIEFDNLEIPVKFDVSNRIKQDLKIMASLYADLYDIENRLRLVLDTLLIAKFGPNYTANLSSNVKTSIEREKQLTQWYVDDNRSTHLQYAQFSDLLKIVHMPGLLNNNSIRQELMDH